MLDSINDENRPQAKQLWGDLVKNLPRAAGSTKSHHAWDYGYRDHVLEVMNLAFNLYGLLDGIRPLPFRQSSALLVLFLHDCEKPFKLSPVQELDQFSWIAERPKKSDKEFQKRLIEHYGFQLSADEWNGLRYVEGENNDYVEGVRTQGPLAAFCHMCDVASARIWYDYPRHQQGSKF